MKQAAGVRVLQIPEGLLGAQLMRLGISEGSELTCALKIPTGPIVVRRGDVEIALGRKIASKIQVEIQYA
jgi:ferrous iron transport protein A